MPKENQPPMSNENPYLQKGVELYKLVMEITSDCLWERDLNSNKIFWIDDGHKRVFGYPVENDHITCAFWESCIHPDDKARVVAKLDQFIAAPDNHTWEDEYRFRKSDGNYLYVCDRAHIFLDDGKKATRLIGATQDITARILVQQKLDAERLSTQKQVTEAILTAQENEKAEIGRKLYDEIGQILAASKMYLHMAGVSEINRQENIDTTMKYIIKVMTDIQQLAKSLVIPPPHIIGLYDNIRNLIADVSVTHALQIGFFVHDLTEDRLSQSLQTTIFRIIQEQITNIVKHSGAANASIDLSMKNGNAVLLISDSGMGCDTRQENNGIGLTSIKSRAEINNGRISVWSRPGEGYFLKVRLPLAVIA